MGLSSLSAGVCLGELFIAAGGHDIAVVYAWVCIAAICATALLVATHALLGRCAAAFRALQPPQQVVTSYHAAFTLAYAVLVFPTTYYSCRLLFMPNQDSPFGFLVEAQKWYTPAFICLDINLALYLMEAGGRSVVKRNWVLLFHHAVFHVLNLIGYLKADVLTLKVGLILNSFAMFEFPLFATLAARKLAAPRQLSVALWWLGMLLYTVTRGLQVTVLAFLFAGSYDDMSGCHKLGLWWANLACVVAISAVQAYTYPIYIGVLKRTLRPMRGIDAALPAGGDADADSIKPGSSTSDLSQLDELA